MTKISIIGCGKLGLTIGRLLKLHTDVTIVDVYNRSPEKTAASVKFIGAGKPVTDFEELSMADIFFITSSDEAIAKVTHNIVATLDLNHSKPAFLHFSGSMPASIMTAAIDKGLATASLHPLKSFADPKKSVQTFAGTFCALESNDQQLQTAIHQLFERLGATVFDINHDKKSLYHAASIICCNYLVTLFDASLTHFKAAGVDSALATQIILSLMGGTINNLKTLPPNQALTGPLERGDIETITKHLDALKDTPQQAELYKTLGINTLPLTQHDKLTLQELHKILNRED